ncbi:MAG: hypothetical protein ACRDRL_15180 [Sciscionella sp.]
MTGEKQKLPERVLRASLLLLGAVFVCNVAIAYLWPLLPWMAGVVATAGLMWLAIALVRWRRSKW